MLKEKRRRSLNVGFAPWNELVVSACQLCILLHEMLHKPLQKYYI